MSELRCRAGDIAYIINDSGCPENNGRLVQVNRLSPIPWEWDSRPHWEITAIGDPLKVLQIDARNWPTGGFEMSMNAEQPDDELLPIRDPGDDAVDEILTLAGKPKEVVA